MFGKKFWNRFWRWTITGEAILILILGFYYLSTGKILVNAGIHFSRLFDCLILPILIFLYLCFEQHAIKHQKKILYNGKYIQKFSSFISLVIFSYGFFILTITGFVTGLIFSTLLLIGFSLVLIVAVCYSALGNYIIPNVQKIYNSDFWPKLGAWLSGN